MNPARFKSLASRYPSLRVAIVGDFCLDRYLEIDPAKQEISIETGLAVHNVVKVRSQPGGAGTILNNLVALGIGTVYPVGFCGTDGEGYELQRALQTQGQSVRMNHFLVTADRRTFTYCKPLVLRPDQPPEELSRLDSKNWTATPPRLQGRLADEISTVGQEIDAMILLDQVDAPETGVVTGPVLEAVGTLAKAKPNLLIIADSRRSLRDYPAVCFKMNAAEFGALTGAKAELGLEALSRAAGALARKQGRLVFLTLSERGLLGAGPDGSVEHVPALPLRGPIDIVGAGDAVMANLAAALASEASLREALEIANAAASIVIHQLGTTGTATVQQIEQVALAECQTTSP